MPPAPDPTKIMPSTMISKRDYGVKIAKRGYDVNFASDTELLYNSSFPVLAIAKYISEDTPREIIESGKISSWNEYTGAYSDSWVYRIRILHELDYVPLVVRSNYERYSMGGNYGVGINWGNKYVYINYTFYSSGDYTTFVNGGSKISTPLIVFAVNIEEDVEYPYFDYAVDVTSWGSQNDYGIKYILNGDENNVDVSDLGLNPNIQSLMVSAVKVTSDMNERYYIPKGIEFNNLSAFCSVKTGGKWAMGDVSVQAMSGYRPINNGDGTGYYNIDGLFFADTVSLVVVRMPFIAPDKTSLSVNM